jgi:hypothetical protein
MIDQPQHDIVRQHSILVTRSDMLVWAFYASFTIRPSCSCLEHAVHQFSGSKVKPLFLYIAGAFQGEAHMNV